MRRYSAGRKTAKHLITLLVAATASPALGGDNGSWRLVETVPAPIATRVQGDHSFTIVTENPRLSGEVHFTEDEGLLSFRLYRNNRVLWEKPAPSSWIFIPAEHDIVIMVGKRYGEGGITEGRNVPERFTAYGANGNQIASVGDTGRVRNVVLFPDGRLLYLTSASIRLLDFKRRGALLWEIPGEFDSLLMFRGLSHFSTGKWFAENDTYTTTLFDVASGRSLKSFTAPFEVRPHFFAISTDQQYAFLRTTLNVNPLTCNFAMYEIGHWDQPVLTLHDLAGGPFVADRNDKDGSVAVGYLPQPVSGDPDDIQPQLDIRDSKGNLLFHYAFDPGPVDLHHSHLRFDSEGTVLRLLIRASEFRFERVKK